jgi:hypothetical protein
MSLDVYLTRNYHVTYDGGKTLEEKEEELYSANITHNLGEMADKAGIYEALWRPHRLREVYDISEDDHFAEREYEDSVTILAKDIIPYLEKGLEKLISKPDYYEKFNSPNGWGMYEHFVPFVQDYLTACKHFPESIVNVSR